MPIPAGVYLGGAALTGLGGWLAGMGQERAAERQMEYDRERRARAAGYLTDYGANWQPYVSPLVGQQKSVLSQYLTGQLTPTQMATIEQQRRIGEAGIGRAAAGAGMPMGGRSALSVQLARDIALGAGQMGAQQQQWAMQAGVPYEQMWLQNWLKQQEIPLEQKRLLAQFA